MHCHNYMIKNFKGPLQTASNALRLEDNSFTENLAYAAHCILLFCKCSYV